MIVSEQSYQIFWDTYRKEKERLTKTNPSQKIKLGRDFLVRIAKIVFPLWPFEALRQIRKIKTERKKLAKAKTPETATGQVKKKRIIGTQLRMF